jgi:hypothetical protein
MKKIILLLAAAIVIASLVYIVPKIYPPPTPSVPTTTPDMWEPFTPLPTIQPPEFIELEVGESALVHGHLIKLISIEGEEIVKMEVLNETTGEPIPTTFNVKEGGASFKYKNISFAPVKIDGENVTVAILEVAFKDPVG